MLIQCENCRTIFDLDETRLKKEGSRVRCSRCKNVFTAYPPAPEQQREKQPAPPPEPIEEDLSDILIPMDIEESPPAQEKDEAFEADLESVYEDALTESLADLKTEGAGSPEDMGPWDKDAGPPEEKEIFEGDIEPLTAAPPRKQPGKSGSRVVLLIILLALLAGGAVVPYFKPDLIEPYVAFFLQMREKKMPEKKTLPDPGARLLQFGSVAGSFVDTAKEGQLFVIRGMVRNGYPEPRSHILVKGSILDNKGKVVDSKVSYAGNTFTEDELKALSLAEVLNALKNREGMALQNVKVKSGASIPFIVVFQSMPDNMSEFAVEAVSSSPGA